MMGARCRDRSCAVEGDASKQANNVENPAADANFAVRITTLPGLYTISLAVTAGVNPELGRSIAQKSRYL